MAITVLNYEELFAGFNRKLVTQLRSHSADNEYLEAWVPDDDPVKSILNMVEAAMSAGLTEVCVRFSSTTASEPQREALLLEITKFADASLDEHGNTYRLNARERKR